MKKKEVSKVQNLIIVPEDVVISCSASFKLDKNNNFIKVIKDAQKFRLAGLNPIYVSDESLNYIEVTTLEKLNNDYH